MIDAEQLLKKRGFKVIEKQRPASVVTYVDGKSHMAPEQADYIVEWSGKKFAVKEISEIGADPTDPVIRRRLIEFKMLFPKYPVLFMNLNSEEIHEVRFEFKGPGRNELLTALIALIVVLMVAGAVILFSQLRLF